LSWVNPLKLTIFKKTEWKIESCFQKKASWSNHYALISKQCSIEVNSKDGLKFAHTRVLMATRQSKYFRLQKTNFICYKFCIILRNCQISKMKAPHQNSSIQTGASQYLCWPIILFTWNYLGDLNAAILTMKNILFFELVFQSIFLLNQILKRFLSISVIILMF